MARIRLKVTKARARKCLKEIAKIINCSGTNEQNAAAFRSIVTALRGPDVRHCDTEEVKLETTGKIRRAIGLESGSGLVVTHRVSPVPAKYLVVDNATVQTSHFVLHINRAIKGLRQLGWKNI